jgi:hypothetical protein
VAAVVDRLRPRLRSYRDEHGRELVDLADAVLPDPDTPAPPRFLADYDNAVLSHADRSRIVTDEHRARTMSRQGIGLATFLVDGFVAGGWRIERDGDGATLVVQPFVPLAATDRSALLDEGARLLAFAAAGAADHDVRLEPMPV